ncbi:ATP-dependent DNA helicase PIF1-like protein, partial [Tanacetum coccineum]
MCIQNGYWGTKLYLFDGNKAISEDEYKEDEEFRQRACRGKVIKSTDYVDLESEMPKKLDWPYDWWCRKCKAWVALIKSQFRLQIHVQDETGTMSLSLFNDEVQAMVGRSAYQLCEKYVKRESDGSIPMEITNLIGNKYAFKVAIDDYNVKKLLHVFTVLCFSNDQEIITSVLACATPIKDNEATSSTVPAITSLDLESQTDENTTPNEKQKTNKRHAEGESGSESSTGKKKAVEIKVKKDALTNLMMKHQLDSFILQNKSTTSVYKSLTLRLIGEDTDEEFDTNNGDLVVSDEEKKNFALFYIEELMRSRGTTLRRWPEMPYPDERYISEFGTGKTFLWKTLAAGIRRKGDIVLNVASSGIASLLMSGGRTAHSRFHIPINIDEMSTCSICPQSDLGALLKKCKLMIWDEAPMTNKLCFEALDRNLRDVLRRTRYDTCETPFGNMTMVFGGDFRKVLPVIPKGSRQDIVNASLKQSYLWDHCNVLKLIANMRLTVGACEIRDFAEWILKVGDGELGEANDGEVSIDVPEELLIDAVDDPVTSIIDFTYPNLLNNINDPSYFQEKAILAPINEVVDTINDHLLNKFPGEEMVYLSCDSIDKTERGSAIDEAVFSPEFINGLKFSGVPNHRLALKVGVPIML